MERLESWWRSSWKVAMFHYRRALPSRTIRYMSNFDLNGEARMATTKQSSPIIPPA